MIVLKVPSKYPDIIDKFIIGKYSEMYTKKDILQIFGHKTYTNKDVEKKVNGKNADIRDILNRNVSSIPTFQKKLIEEFDVQLRVEDLLEHEQDFPPLPKEEIFNS